MNLTSTDWLTLALVVITGLYAWATFRILRANEAVVGAMKEQTEAQLRPYIVVSAAPRIGTTLMCLHIENAGRSSAEDVRLTMDRAFYPHAERSEHENIARLPAFTEAIRTLAPGVKMTFNLGVGHKIFGAAEELCPRVFGVKAAYSFGSRRYTDEHTVDLRPLMHTSVVHDPVAEEIEKLRKTLEKLAQAKSDA